MTPYVGEIKLWPCPRVPENWALCDGTLYKVADYQALFSLIGTTYGGNGTTTFGVPDLRGRIPVGQGQGTGLTNRVIGQQFGTEQVPLLLDNLPAHQHTVGASTTAANAMTPTNNLFATVTGVNFYASPTASGATTVQLAPNTIGQAGGGLPHSNLMPFLCVNYIIAMQGVFPVRS